MIFPWDKIWEAIDKKIDAKINEKFEKYSSYLDDRMSSEKDRIQEALKSQIFQGLEESLENRKITAPLMKINCTSGALSDITLTYSGVKSWWESLLNNDLDPIFGSKVSFQNLYADYAHKSQTGITSPIGQTPFSKFFWKICPGVTSVSQNGAKIYTIPPIGQCRIDFVNYIKEDRRYGGTLYRVGMKPQKCTNAPHRERSFIEKRLDENLARNVKTLLEVTSDHKTIAKLTGISASTVYNIKKGQSFRKLSPWPQGTEREECYNLLGRKEALSV